MWVQDRLFDLPAWDRFDIEPCVWPNCKKEWIIERSFNGEKEWVWVTGLHTDGSERHSWEGEIISNAESLNNTEKPSRRWWEFWKE